MAGHIPVQPSAFLSSEVSLLRQILRPYQREGLAQIMEAFRGGARRVLAVGPTAMGKTTLFCEPIADLAAAGVPCLINVHRRELATQAANRLREFGVPFGFIMSGEPERPDARVQIASVQTLVRRKPPPARFVVNDEAHLSTAVTWRKILDAYPAARVLGVTATPWRLSGKPLVGSYDAVVVVSTPRLLRDLGWLCPYVGFSYLTPDLTTVKTTAGDYNEQQSSAAMRQPQIVDSIVEEWLKHASHLSTVVFAVTVEHSKELCARFRKAGIAAEHLDGKTDTIERRAILRRVEAGITRVLCNVGVAVEGLDIPRLKCCVLARPTKSLARYIQMVGRVRRIWVECRGCGHGWSARPIDTHCPRCNGTDIVRQPARVHDHAFTIRLHGLPDADRDYSLNAKPEKPPSLTQCPQCFCMYAGRPYNCPECDAETPRQNDPSPGLATVPDAEKFEFGSDTEPEAQPLRSERPTAVRWDRPGRIVEGIYIGVQSEKTDWGSRKLHILRGDKRDYALPGTVDLDRKMAQVKLGEHATIEFLSENDISGGKRKKLFRVEADDGT